MNTREMMEALLAGKTLQHSRRHGTTIHLDGIRIVSQDGLSAPFPANPTEWLIAPEKPLTDDVLADALDNVKGGLFGGSDVEELAKEAARRLRSRGGK